MNAAFHEVTKHQIGIPAKDYFNSEEEYYATLAHEMIHNAEARIMPTRLPRPRLARRRGVRQRLFTEEPWALAGQSRPADDRRDGSGGL